MKSCEIVVKMLRNRSFENSNFRFVDVTNSGILEFEKMFELQTNLKLFTPLD